MIPGGEGLVRRDVDATAKFSERRLFVLTHMRETRFARPFSAGHDFCSRRSFLRCL
ncbi:MAG: hypothetical protein JWR69_914 [Pedosphaera sp.]|nr:hypothetical protein [Pedosphaera sp.]